MVTLVNIPNSNATIRADHYNSLAAAFAQLVDESGIVPVVLAGKETSDGIPGGSRTLQESYAAGSGPASDHYEDNQYGHSAVDINNQRVFRNWNESRFIQIMSDQGWHNMQINGAPFPNEPWHFATHGGAEPAGGGTTPFDINKIMEQEMIVLFITDSVDGNGVAGWMLLNPRTGKSVQLRVDYPGGQAIADSWGRVWGSASKCTRADYLNALDAIKKTA